MEFEVLERKADQKRWAPENTSLQKMLLWVTLIEKSHREKTEEIDVHFDAHEFDEESLMRSAELVNINKLLEN